MSKMPLPGPGSKESRIADAVRWGSGGEYTLAVGHPYIDIWQAVKPARVGLSEWPTVPRTIELKYGVCQALGWLHRGQAARACTESGVQSGTGPIWNPNLSAGSRN